MDYAKQTEVFFEQWGVSLDALVASIRGAFSSECLWEQRPLAVTTGIEEAVAFQYRSKATMGMETIDVDMLHISSSPDGTVHTERVDHIRSAEGRLIVSVPVAGVLEWQDGKIVAWREYFDSASLVPRALSSIVSATARRAAARLRRRP
jgi:limonene-1,2-epoxide hydrolase